LAARPKSTAQQEPQPRPVVLPIVVVVVLLLVGAAAVLILNPFGEAEPPASPTAIAAAVTEDATPEKTRPVAAATDTDNETAEPAASETETEESNSATRTPRAIAAATTDDAATDTTTEDVTETATPDDEGTEGLVSPSDLSPIAPEAEIILRYDEDSMILFNNTERSLNVRGLTFIQETEERALTFNSNSWVDAARLPSGVCFRVWQETFVDLPVPPYCDSQLNWRAVSRLRYFWRSETEGANFEVRQGEDVLVVCEIAAGECGFSMN
jgi:cytoskeletal protein RodZ